MPSRELVATAVALYRITNTSVTGATTEGNYGVSPGRHEECTSDDERYKEFCVHGRKWAKVLV